MRSSLLPGMLRILRHNLNRESESLRLVTVDRVFVDDPGSDEGLPREPERLVAMLCGASRRPSWNEPDRPADLYDLKGDAEALLEQLGVDSVWSRGYTEPFMDSAASFLISGSYGAIGGGGTVQAEVLRRFDVDVPVFWLDLDVDSLEKHLPTRRAFLGIPRFPAVKRDLSLLVPRQVDFADLQRVVSEVGGKLLESVQCFDVFEDPALGDGTRSIGLRLRFRSPERTLLDDMVEPVMQNIRGRLQSDLGVTLRVA